MKRLISFILCLVIAVGGTNLCIPAAAEQNGFPPSKEVSDGKKTVNLYLKRSADFYGAVQRIKGTGVTVVSENSALSLVTVKGQADLLAVAENFSFIERFVPAKGLKRPTEVDNEAENYGYSGFRQPTVQAEEADLSDDGSGTVIAVIDSGFNLDHECMRLSGETEVSITKEAAEDMIERIGYGAYYNEKIPFYFNYADADYNMLEQNNRSHGMGVASLAAGNGSSFSAYARNAQLILMRVFSESSEYADDFTVARAIVDAADLGADVINLSLGSQGGISDNECCYKQAVDYAEQKGALVVAAAGNEGDANYALDMGIDKGIMSTPGDLEKVLSVGAVNSSLKSASFSSFGPNSDLTFGNKLVASGVSVLSADNDGYSEKSGTSFSSPITASAAALAAKKVKKYEHTGYTVPRLVTALIENSAKPVDEFNCKQASGVLDPQTMLQNDVLAFSEHQNGLIQLGEIADSAAVRVTLVNFSDTRDITLSVFTKNEWTEDFEETRRYEDTGLYFDQKEITVPAGQSVEFTAQLRVGETVPKARYITGHLCFEGGGNFISCPYLGYYGRWDDDPVISERNDETGLSLYSFNGEEYTKNSVISANGDGVNDYLFPFFFQLRSAEYIKIDIYSEEMEFISNAAYTVCPMRDQYNAVYDTPSGDPVAEKAAAYVLGLGFSAYGYDAQSGMLYELQNGNYYAVIETKLCFDGAKTERHTLGFTVTDYVPSTDYFVALSDTDEYGDIEIFNCNGVGNWRTAGPSDVFIKDGRTVFDCLIDAGTDADAVTVNGALAGTYEEGNFHAVTEVYTDRYTPVRITAFKGERPVSQRCFMIKYDGTAPSVSTDIKSRTVPEWLKKRLGYDFEGLCDISDFNGRFKLTVSDGDYYGLDLAVDGVYVQIGGGTNAFDRYLYCNSKQKGDIMTVGCYDRAENEKSLHYLFTDGDPILGDADLDQRVTANDALLALQSSVGAVGLGMLSAALADVDQTVGNISANDALLILQASVGAVGLSIW